MKKIVVGMSGGVDSSVSAVLLKKQGYEVIGVTMKMWENEKDPNFQIGQDAKKVCELLNIPHYILDSTKEFKENVINNFITTYQKAETPNPCIECNRNLKFGCLWEFAKSLGCEYISTGHYAKTAYSDKFKQVVLKKADSNNKDQSYFLYAMNKEVLPRLVFPLENYINKDEIREIAKAYFLPVAAKKDSQEVCFIPNDDYTNFLLKATNQEPKAGDFVTKEGKILGKHKGLIFYTVGQRKGLGISYREPLYVIELKQKENEVVLGTIQDLYNTKVRIKNVNWLVDPKYIDKEKIKAKIRYRAIESPCQILQLTESRAEVLFNEPQKAITPGQSLVFYEGDIVLGGGIMER